MALAEAGAGTETAPTRPQSQGPAAAGNNRERRNQRKRERDANLARADRAALLANAVLMSGYAFALWFQAYDFNGRARERTAIVVYFVGFALLILSGLIELCVDMFSVRTTGHGRYHADSPAWNISLSYLFISAGVLDIVAFIYWMRKEFNVENTVLLVSSYVLLAMAALALYFQTAELRELGPDASSADRIDFAANLIVLAVTVLGVAVRHMEFSGGDFGDATDRMELATVPLWLFSSVLYVGTDMLRLHWERGDR